MHKVIILDLPNVIVTDGKVSLDAIKVLNRLTEGTGADLVLLPTWPGDLAFADIRLAMVGVGVSANILDCTPRIPALGRSGEAQMWLDEYRWTVAAYIILSADSEFVEEFGTRMVLVDNPNGLTLETAQKAAQALGL